MNYIIIAGFRKNSELLYTTGEKMIYAKKSVYKNVIKYECRQKTCKVRVNVLPDGKCVPARKNVEHNHGHEEEIYKELKALNAIKQDCQNVAGALGGTKTNISTIRNAFRKACEGNQADTKNLIFSKLQRGLQKIISKNFITSPKNALQQQLMVKVTLSACFPH
ncbi:hypothetical protein FF38_10360 [Lucilia cuprina]|uniref:FLYWCH-type domain-containing protein n=1 Tax=Lucilia cuprina TaxID=7375 RepID=A0A0L0C0A0_LUCCU|nr:hypothetical protein FF38_10360 [Lucilia cuprina]